MPVFVDATLLEWCAQAFMRRGATVIVRPGEANLIRRRDVEAGGGFEVIVEGLPNLLHELAHAALFGGLADDHGFDYGRIPLQIERDSDRRLLWEEFAAAVLSCAYLEALPATIDAWFAEQVEIQGVFYGLDGDLDRLYALFDGALKRYGQEAESVLCEAYRAVSTWLREAGAPPQICRPYRRYRAAELWRRYQGHRAGRSSGLK